MLGMVLLVIYSRKSKMGFNTSVREVLTEKIALKMKKLQR
jgi:hypothetical protein